MKNISSLVLFACLLGCSPQPKMSPYEYGRSLLCPGKYREAFLFWPTWEDDVKDEPEGFAGHEYTLMMTCTSGCGWKDWVGIFKEPNIPMELKLDLLSYIHGGSIEYGYDEYLTLSYKETLGKNDKNNLHSAVLSYIEYMKQTNYKVDKKQYSQYFQLLESFRKNKDEEILPYIFMDSRIPESIKAHIILVLQIVDKK